MAEKVSNQSLWTWLFQRLSGLFLAFFLVTHLNVHHLFHDITEVGIINFAAVQSNLASSVWWQVYYILFIPFVVFHALNGLWAIMADYRVSPGMTVFLKTLFWIVGIILIVVGTLTLINLF
jgi:succinate dehydrogenase hydrophobic anchor subunit